MIYLVMEDSRAPLFTEDLYNTVPKSSIVKIKKSTLDLEVDKLNSSPLFTSKWFALIDRGVSENLIVKICSMKSVVPIIYVTDKTVGSVRSVISEFGENKLVNLINPSKSFCEKHVCKVLSVTEDVSKCLCEKSNYFLPSLEENINVLKSLGRAPSKKDINLYISRRNSVTIYSLFYFILGQSKVLPKNIIVFMHDFKYAFSYLKESLLKLFDDMLQIYDDIENAIVGKTNIDSYYKSSKLGCTLFFTKRVVLEFHKIFTYEEIYLRKLKLARCSNVVELLNYIL